MVAPAGNAWRVGSWRSAVRADANDNLSSAICHAQPRRLDFPSCNASFLGFEAPVAQLDRVYDFGS